MSYPRFFWLFLVSAISLAAPVRLQAPARNTSGSGGSGTGNGGSVGAGGFGNFIGTGGSSTGSGGDEVILTGSGGSGTGGSAAAGNGGGTGEGRRRRLGSREDGLWVGVNGPVALHGRLFAISDDPLERHVGRDVDVGQERARSR